MGGLRLTFQIDAYPILKTISWSANTRIILDEFPDNKKFKSMI